MAARVSGGVDHWHRVIATLDVELTRFEWDDGDQFGIPSRVVCCWRDGDAVVEVIGSGAINYYNMIAYVFDARLATHPSTLWLRTSVNTAAKHLAILQFPGAGTWALARQDNVAVATFTRRARELRVIHRRARGLVVGEGETPRKVNVSWLNAHVERLGLPLRFPQDVNMPHMVWPPPTRWLDGAA